MGIFGERGGTRTLDPMIKSHSETAPHFDVITLQAERRAKPGFELFHRRVVRRWEWPEPVAAVGRR